MKLTEIFDKSKKYWGIESQILMLAEECSELTVASLHLLRHSKIYLPLEHFAEEIADVELLIEEMKYYFNLHDTVKKYRKIKEKRVEKKLLREEA